VDAPRRGEVLALSATIGVAALTRLVDLDLMEFKADEAEACRLALHALGRAEPGSGNFFPTAGLVASVGFPNPPLFVYLLALPLAIARTPLSAAVFVALANVIAVCLCYVAGKRIFSSAVVGLYSAALFASSPWAIVYSRKIWAQNMLPILTCLFLLALQAFLVQKRPRAVFWLFVLVGAATQIHFSAWVLAAVLAVALILGREAVARRWVAFGAVVVALLYVPFLWHLAAVGADTSQTSTGHVAPGIARRFLTSARDTLAVSGGDRLSMLVGSQSPLAFPLSVVLGTAGLLGLVAACRRWRGAPAGRLLVLLPLWYVLPLAALTVVPVTPYLHYFIVLFPLPFFGLAFALERLTRRRRTLGPVALAACLAAFGFLDAGLLRTIVRDGGAPAEYGVAYRYKADAMGELVRENPVRRVVLGADAHPDKPAPQEYRFLAWNERGAADPPLAVPAFRYVIAESFSGTAPVLRRLPHSPPIGRFGPVQVAAVPIRGQEQAAAARKRAHGEKEAGP
jgi:hypothetical protein